jgi:hypothetical protein
MSNLYFNEHVSFWSTPKSNSYLRTSMIQTSSSPSFADSSLPSNTLLATLMTSPYRATSHFVITQPFLMSSHLLSSNVIPLIPFIFIHNNFSYNLFHYFQVKGTRMAPSYANPFMGSQEDDLLNSEDSKPNFC